MTRATRRLPLYVRDDPPLYKVARGLLTSALRLYHRYELSGADRLPATGPAIVVSNHPSDIDPIILGVAFGRPLHFMADVVQFRRGFVGRVIPRLGAFPVNKGAADRAALRAALDLLAAGQVVALFPEADLYTDGVLHPFEPGIGFLAAASGAPVVPAAITGACGIADRRWLDWPTVRLTVGEPVDFGGTSARGRLGWEQRTSRVEAAVRELRERGLLAERCDEARRRRRAASDGLPADPTQASRGEGVEADRRAGPPAVGREL